MSETLAEQRRQAAAKSRGVSSAAIYQRVLVEAKRSSVEGHVLDFGAGQGDLTALLQTVSAIQQITSVDLLPGTVGTTARCRWLTADLNQRLPLEDGSFDAVVAVEVIEHLENGRAVLREISRLLRPGGLLILTTPNSENIRSYLSLAIKRNHWAFTDTSYPAHIVAFLESDLYRAASEAGFHEIRFDYDGDGCVPGITRLSWREITGGVLRGRLFCDTLLMVARRAP